MSRIFAFASLLVLAGIALPAARAEDSALVEEVKVLRGLVEKQTRQIDALAEQLARLRIALEKHADVPIAATTDAPATPAPAPAEAAPAPATAEFSSEVPKAEAADGRRHVVIKGETLTSIAKHYSLSLGELKKANKDVDERRLQIGQTLIIPPAKTPEPPATKE